MQPVTSPYPEKYLLQASVPPIAHLLRDFQMLHLSQVPVDSPVGRILFAWNSAITPSIPYELLRDTMRPHFMALKGKVEKKRVVTKKTIDPKLCEQDLKLVRAKQIAKEETVLQFWQIIQTDPRQLDILHWFKMKQKAFISALQNIVDRYAAQFNERIFSSHQLLQRIDGAPKLMEAVRNFVNECVQQEIGQLEGADHPHKIEILEYYLLQIELKCEVLINHFMRPILIKWHSEHLQYLALFASTGLSSAKLISLCGNPDDLKKLIPEETDYDKLVVGVSI